MKQWCTNYKFSQNELTSRYSTQNYIYTRHVFFAQMSFETHDPTQPTKNKFSTHSRPNPIQPNPRVNPTHGQLWARQTVSTIITPNRLWSSESVPAAARDASRRRRKQPGRYLLNVHRVLASRRRFTFRVLTYGGQATNIALLASQLAGQPAARMQRISEDPSTSFDVWLMCTHCW